MLSNTGPVPRMMSSRRLLSTRLPSRLLVCCVAVSALLGCGQREAGTAPAVASAGAPAAAAANTPLPLIPAPAQVTRGSGSFHIGAGTVISIVGGDADARRSAEYLAELLKRTRGLSLEVRNETSASPGSIRLERSAQAPVAQKEGYSLDSDAKGLRIQARDGAGLFYGTVSAWQLMTPDARKGDVEVPAVAIRDWPRFSWRGQHLDVARHFHDVATVKHVLDTMAVHKLNVLHWHLTDDQGWRIEIKRYPKLTEVGAGAPRRPPLR